MTKKTIRGLCVLCAAVLLGGCGSRSEAASEGKLRVVTTLFPLYDFALHAGGDRVEVSLMVPPGAEAHFFEPGPQDVLRVSNADVFIYTGAAMEPWAEDFLAGVKNPPRVLEAGKGIFRTEEAPGHEEEHAHEDEHAHEEEDGTPHEHTDPHIWLDLEYAQEMLRAAGEVFSDARPADRDYFKANAEAYAAKLAGLDSRIFVAVQSFRRKTIVCAGHFAFGYFARRYGLEYVSPYPGFSPDTEMTPRRLARLSRAVEEQGLEYIFHEELVEPRAAEIISRETGARLLLLHGGHAVSKKELDSGVSFLDLMEQNFANLKLALGDKKP